MGLSPPVEAMVSVNFTPEGVAVVPGQVWKDLDWRMAQRLVRVERVVEHQAVMLLICERGQAIPATQPIRVPLSKMYKSSTGWALVHLAR
jgi:hypothetical protein